MCRLKELDISFLSQLATKTSVIPIIGKADTMTADERLEFKKSVGLFFRHTMRDYD